MINMVIKRMLENKLAMFISAVCVLFVISHFLFSSNAYLSPHYISRTREEFSNRYDIRFSVFPSDRPMILLLERERVGAVHFAAYVTPL